MESDSGKMKKNSNANVSRYPLHSFRIRQRMNFLFSFSESFMKAKAVC